MNKEDIKLIVSDIDGTLISDWGALPDNFHEMLDQLKERDITFVAASGRGLSSINSLLKSNAENLYLISDNGAMITKDNEILSINHFTDEEYHTLIDHFEQFEGVSFGITTAEGSYVKINPETVTDEFKKEYFHQNTEVEDLRDVPGVVVGFSVNHPERAHEYFASKEMDAIKDQFSIVMAGAHWIDAIPGENNKGDAIKELATILDLSVDNAIAFGDFNNDVEMLKTVKKGFAMQDATEAVKAVADEVIGSNNDNSVIKKIYELLEIE